MGGTTEYSGQLTIEDALRGFMLYRSRQRSWRWWLVLWGLAVFAGTAALDRRQSPLAPALPVLLFVLLALLLVYVSVPWQLRRSLAEQRALYLPYETRIDESGFATRTDLDSQGRRWSDFKRWCEDAHYCVLVESESIVRVVPKRVLGSAQRVAELRDLLRCHLGPAA